MVACKRDVTIFYDPGVDWHRGFAEYAKPQLERHGYRVRLVAEPGRREIGMVTPFGVYSDPYQGFHVLKHVAPELAGKCRG